MRPPFELGQAVDVGGLRLAVGRGTKSPDDLVLFRWDGNGWVAVPMSLMALLFDFFVQNERGLASYRPNWKNDAEEHLRRYLHAAATVGWRQADRDMVIGPRRAL